jgi:hypothetical protein
VPTVRAELTTLAADVARVTSEALERVDAGLSARWSLSWVCLMRRSAGVG